MKHGYEIISFNDVKIPTFTFGGGNIRVTSGWEDGDGFDGVLFSLAPENTTVGDEINPELEGKTFDQIPDIKCYMRFDNPASIDVVIGKLESCKSKLTGFANKGDSEENMQADNALEGLLSTLESTANFMRGMTMDNRLPTALREPLIARVSVIDELTESFNEAY